MTDTTETNENIEAVEMPEARPHHLFEEGADSARVHHLAQSWAGDSENLKEALWFFRRVYLNEQEHTKQAGVRSQHLEERMQGMRIIAERDKTALRKALEEIYGDMPKVMMEWDGWKTYLAMAFHIGIMTGYAGETHRLVIALKYENEIEGIEDLWDTISRDLRTPDGTYPNPVPAERATGEAWRIYGYRLSVQVHPADPRLDEGWRKLWMLAKSEGLCEVFDTLADSLGVHKPEITRSGTVTVRFSGYVDVDVSEWDGDDIWEVVDDDDVRQAIRYDGHLEMDDIDTSELTWD